MKVVFLDIDGVLNRLTDLPPLIDGRRDWERNFHPPAVAALNDLLRVSGARIVVSSTWRLSRGFEELRELLASWGIEGEVVGVTPEFPLVEERPAEIRAWLRGAPRVTRYVAIDDMDMTGEVVQVLVDPLVGLTAEDARAAALELAD